MGDEDLQMLNIEKKVEEVLGGKIRILRFNAAEQGGSSLHSDRFLWTGILLAESELAEFEHIGLCTRPCAADGGAPPPCRFLESISQELPATLDELASALGLYADRGQESIVCDSGDGFVTKLRLMRPSMHSGYLAPLANIVYHNRLFLDDRYTLENIYRDGQRYFMVLRQPRVDILLDDDGYPVRPTSDQIRAAIDANPAGLVEWEDSSEDEDFSGMGDSSSGGSRLRFYNSDYYVSDLQPGRNVVIDANTGALRFIDPRITLNDPQGPITCASRFGRRRESMPGQIV